MPFSSNFTKVTRAVDNGRDVLFVEGKTEESEQVREMYVNVGSLATTRVENAPGAADWVATLNGGELPDVDTVVTVVGVAERDGVDQPFLWGQTLRVEAA